MPKFITLTQLEAAFACSRSRERFEALFGPRVRVTEELAKVAAAEFSWSWAAEYLLSKKGQRIYAKAAVPARDVFGQALAPLRAEYRVSQGAAVETAWRTYEAARDKARLALDLTLAVAFAKAYVADD